jgi:hypothetical protein
VDEPTEYVVAINVAERQGSRGHRGDRCRHFEPEAAVRPMLVVMPDVVAKDCFEVVATENERPVEAVGCKRRNAALTSDAANVPGSSA